MTDSFLTHLQRAAAVVANWPAWKQAVLGGKPSVPSYLDVLDASPGEHTVTEEPHIIMPLTQWSEVQRALAAVLQARQECSMRMGMREHECVQADDEAWRALYYATDRLAEALTIEQGEACVPT